MPERQPGDAPTEIAIAGRAIGPGQPPYVIAEMSANHKGELDRALRIIAMAQEAGADAVKLQTYRADTITIDHDGPAFRIDEGLWAGRRLYDLYQEAFTPWEWHERLFDEGRRLGITVFSSPFDPTAVDLLAGLAAPAYKIASFEIVDLPLIQRVAREGRPTIISTGMASAAEIAEAVEAARVAGCRDLVLLHCISGYPTPIGESNLRTITDLAAHHGCLVGLSDHTMGITAAVAAVALGACVIEKHVTLSRAEGGHDAAFSLEPDELKALVETSRAAWQALGAVRYGPKDVEAQSLRHRRSLYAVGDIAAGEAIDETKVRSIRPAGGLAPKHLPQVLGRRARQPIAKGTPISWDLLTAD